MVEEKVYRERVQAIFSKVEKAFDSIDPDVAECDQSQGALSIVFSDGSKCILSAQPSVRQLWMAVAAKGVAFHFDYEEATGRWLDDKGRGIEATQYLRDYLREAASVDLKLELGG